MTITSITFNPLTDPKVFEVGNRMPHDTHSGNGATIQKMELDATGAIIIHLAGGRIKVFGNIPMEIDVVEDKK